MLLHLMNKKAAVRYCARGLGGNKNGHPLKGSRYLFHSIRINSAEYPFEAQYYDMFLFNQYSHKTAPPFFVLPGYSSMLDALI